VLGPLPEPPTIARNLWPRSITTRQSSGSAQQQRAGCLGPERAGGIYERSTPVGERSIHCETSRKICDRCDADHTAVAAISVRTFQ